MTDRSAGLESDSKAETCPDGAASVADTGGTGADGAGKFVPPGVDHTLRRRLKAIRRKWVVLSGKGGVGKSTVAANLALALAAMRKDTGLLDVDVHGPSIPRMLGLENARPVIKGDYLIPPEIEGRLKVMSLGFLFREKDEAVIWRGPMKTGAIRQMLRDTEWGDLDALVVDCPPGTGDEPLTILQLIGDVDGAVIVTTPQEVALADVRRSIQFCRKLGAPIAGVIENMSGFVCPHCGERTDVFKSGGAEAMARDMDVPFLGRIPLDPALMRACDAGRLRLDPDAPSATAAIFRTIAEALRESRS